MTAPANARRATARKTTTPKLPYVAPIDRVVSMRPTTEAFTYERLDANGERVSWLVIIPENPREQATVRKAWPHVNRTSIRSVATIWEFGGYARSEYVAEQTRELLTDREMGIEFAYTDQADIDDLVGELQGYVAHLKQLQSWGWKLSGAGSSLEMRLHRDDPRIGAPQRRKPDIAPEGHLLLQDRPRAMEIPFVSFGAHSSGGDDYDRIMSLIA